MRRRCDEVLGGTLLEDLGEIVGVVDGGGAQSSRTGEAFAEVRSETSQPASVVILTDAGPLIALIDRRDAEHRRCVSAAEGLVGPMLSTWPVLTEATYLLGSSSSWRGQEPLWRMVRAGQLLLADISAGMLARTPALMEQYKDLPMDRSGRRRPPWRRLAHW